ncbi:22614_t:CDS:2 [Gigaspora margarita]|uniref:22614_t:CDS:1 n=1 Tax=Gigaspora margarita TaxID=4874 RepID=A0ABN7UJZ7_GIGMA|nr:22614_t:CDS:2 [Gigaspora margarita]
MSEDMNKGKNVKLNKIMTLPELLEFDQMENVNELHRSYTMLLHEMQQDEYTSLLL